MATMSRVGATEKSTGGPITKNAGGPTTANIERTPEIIDHLLKRGLTRDLRQPAAAMANAKKTREVCAR
jgi:hypothetical protein